MKSPTFALFFLVFVAIFILVIAGRANAQNLECLEPVSFGYELYDTDENLLGVLREYKSSQNTKSLCFDDTENIIKLASLPISWQFVEADAVIPSSNSYSIAVTYTIDNREGIDPFDVVWIEVSSGKVSNWFMVSQSEIQGNVVDISYEFLSPVINSTGNRLAVSAKKPNESNECWILEASGEFLMVIERYWVEGMDCHPVSWVDSEYYYWLNVGLYESSEGKHSANPVMYSTIATEK